jgi:DNA-binding CsgD family transcriptional regulator
VTGDTETLRLLKHWHVGSGSTFGKGPFWALADRSYLAQIAWLTNDLELAREQYNALHGRELAPEVPRLQVAYGVLARMLGKLDEAVEQLRSTCQTQKWSLPYHVQCCHELAQTLVLRDPPGDCHEARTVWTEALELADAHGLAPWSGRIREGLERLQNRAGRAAAATYPDGLTERELEVLRLVTRGLTNKEIAYELSISINTVSTHLKHLMQKTRCVNRADAAAYAMRNGLLPEVPLQDS